MKTDNNAIAQNEGTSPAPKKPYSRPELLVYGDLREITKAVGGIGAHDGGATAGHDKTTHH